MLNSWSLSERESYREASSHEGLESIGTVAAAGAMCSPLSAGEPVVSVRVDTIVARRWDGVGWWWHVAAQVVIWLT